MASHRLAGGGGGGGGGGAGGAGADGALHPALLLLRVQAAPQLANQLRDRRVKDVGIGTVHETSSFAAPSFRRLHSWPTSCTAGGQAQV